jgi:endonuclease/exonuclease/phosphatase family metal-dependent hydrolase
MFPALRTVALGLLSAVALAGCAKAPKVSEPGPEFSVLSYNIWHDQRDWPARKAMMIEEIKRLNPDVIGLQEVLQRETLPNQAETLAKELGYVYTFSTTDPPENAHRYGNAILTRHKMLSSDMQLLRPLDDYRTVAHMRIDVDGRVVDVYNTHLHHTGEGGEIRREQIKDLLSFIESTRKGTAVIVTGDFNASPDWPEVQLMTPEFVDTFAQSVENPLSEEHATLNHHVGHSKRRIDYVWQHRGSLDQFRAVRSEIVLDEPDASGEVWASDHWGVITWFQ